MCQFNFFVCGVQSFGGIFDRVKDVGLTCVMMFSGFKKVARIILV
jgi:hypothetical protein